MSVKELCEAAGISRQTFYHHFDSKYQIAYWFFDLADELFAEHIGRDIGWDEGISEYMQFIAKELPYLHYAFAANPFDNEVEPYLESGRKRLVTTLTEFKHVEIDDELSFCLDFFISHSNEIVVDWCLSDAPLPPEDMTKYFTDCTPHKLYMLLKEPVQKKQAR